ncbi:hypothetical protein [Azospirillum argentinense]|uniref:hypothetical protein n=1 Tax=Azospirillum argentinense TaxID=2970906 RepID=UPI0011AF9070|nr:hypothetical protein [Azospirillum argentinense]
MARSFTPSRVLPEPVDGAAVMCSDCGAWGIRRIDSDELMERLLADWPVAGSVLAGLMPLMPSPELGDLCRQRALAAYAAVLEEEDWYRLLAFIDAVVDCTTDQLKPTGQVAAVPDLMARVLPVRVQSMLNETRARKRSLSAAN